MASLFTRFKNILGGAVDYAELSLGADPNDNTPRRIPQSVPSDAGGSALYAAGDKPALDGTDATGVTPPAGGAGLRGWLSGIYAKLPALVGGKIPVDIGGASVTITGGVTIPGSVEVSNDVGNPLPVRSQRNFTPAQSFVSVPAYNSADTTTIKLVATITAGMGLLMIDNNGSADVELWFGAKPADMQPPLLPGQTIPQGKRIAAGGGVFTDVSMLTGPVYATASGATGLAVVTGA